MDFDLSEEQRFWKKTVHDFVAAEIQPRAREVDATGEFNWQSVRKGGPIGLLGLYVPEEYGGAAVDGVSAAISLEELGWACGSTALALAAHNSLGTTPIVAYGSEQQKRQWLPILTDGQHRLSCLALTEPGAGSDLQGGVITRAVREAGGWRLNGEKMWCTNATVGECIVTLARTRTAGGSKDFSMFIVPIDAPGLKVGPPEKKMGLHGSPTSAVKYDDVHIPDAALLGEEGRGLQQALETLDAGRITIGALSVGLAQAAMEHGIRYAQERRAFGRQIGEFQAIQFMLSDAATEIEAARLLVYQAAWLKDQGRPFSHAASMAKLFATEMAERVARNAIQIHGGYGYSQEYHVERIYRDARLMTIGEGTSEIQRLVIARHLLRSEL